MLLILFVIDPTTSIADDSSIDLDSPGYVDEFLFRYKNNELNKTAPVGSYEAGKSDYGVYDLSGNVAEWTYDWHFAEFYLFSPKTNPIGPKKGHYKVIRGGNWRSKLEEVSMTYRNATVPSTRINTLGFRCAQSADSILKDKYPAPH